MSIDINKNTRKPNVGLGVRFSTVFMVVWDLLVEGKSDDLRGPKAVRSWAAMQKATKSKLCEQTLDVCSLFDRSHPVFHANNTVKRTEDVSNT